MAGVLVEESDLKRIGRGIRQIEELRIPEPVPHFTREPRHTIRAQLLEPLYGHGMALAQVGTFERYGRLAEVAIVGQTLDSATWSLRIDPGTSRLPTVTTPTFRTDATAAEVRDAILSVLPVGDNDLYVLAGAIPGRVIPDTLNGTPESLYIQARWTIAFAGQVFARTSPVVVPGQSAVSNSAMMLSSASRWRPTSEIVYVIEAGLNPDSVRTYGSYSNYTTSRYPLVSGTVVLAHWCHDASGYVVGSAEPRKFRI